MTAVCIIAGIIAFFSLLFSFSVRADFKYFGGEPELKVKYMFLSFRLMGGEPPVSPLGEKEKKPETENEKSYEETITNLNEFETEPDESLSGGEDEAEEPDRDGEPAEKRKLNEKIDGVFDKISKVKAILDSSKKGIRKITRNIHIDGLMIDFIIAGDDAFKTAMSYGAVCASVYNCISAIRLFFPIKVRSVDIKCDFDRKKPVFDGEVTVRIRVWAMLGAGISVLWGLIRNRGKIFGKDDSGKPEKKKGSISEDANAVKV